MKDLLITNLFGSFGIDIREFIARFVLCCPTLFCFKT